VVVVVPPLGRVQVLWATTTSWARGVPGASMMCTALTVRVCPPLDRVCSFNTTEPSAPPGPSGRVVLGGGIVEGTAGEPGGSTKVVMNVVPVGVVPLASQVELIVVPLISPTANAATDAELMGEVGEAFAVSPLAVSAPKVTVPSAVLGGAVGVGATVIGPVALIPKAVPEPGVWAPEVPLVAMRKTPTSRKAADATPATLGL
jgi:hypothetical protein